MRIRHFTLTAFLVALVLTGCTEDRYALEKRYWHLRRQSRRIIQNPHGSPPALYQQSINQLRRFIADHPELPQSIDLELYISKLYLAAGAYNMCRASLQELLAKYPSTQSLAAEIIYLTGRSFEKEDDWDQAVTYYDRVISEYPDTEEAIFLPIYKAKYYQKRVKESRMIAAYRAAIRHYQAMADRNLGTKIAYRADMLTAYAYTQLEEWKDALTILEMVIHEYKDRFSVEGAVINKILIYRRELRDDVAATEATMQLAQMYPKSAFLKLSQHQIKLKKLYEE
ncbi:MAG: tetratricopeptide repeat protein [Candidatus Omnitrophica bacterium]|nr:tetratricopeptide repeat protein [Candidatus Omnitrophota bacterium]